jgi:hypothetical protein
MEGGRIESRGRAKALMDEASFTALLKRSSVSSERGWDERSFVLKRPEGSLSEAPLAKVSFTTVL